MFCSSCGKKIEDDSLFCEYCGAKQDEIPVPGWVQDDEMDFEEPEWEAPKQAAQRRTRPAQSSSANGGASRERRRADAGRSSETRTRSAAAPSAGEPSGSMNLLVKIILFIFCGLYAIVGIIRLFGGIITFVRGIGLLINIRIVQVLFAGIGGVLMSLVYILMAVMLIFAALGQNRDNTGSLFAGISLSGALVIIMKLCGLIFRLIIGMGSLGKGVFLPMLYAILVAAIAYVLFVVAGHAPHASMTGESVGIAFGSLGETFSNITADLKSGKAEKDQMKRKAAEASAASAAAAAVNRANGNAMGQGQMNGAGYGQQGGYGPQGGYGAGMAMGPAPAVRKLNEHRGLIKYIFFGMLTCGIYGFYFIYKLSEDVNTACFGDGRDVTGGLGAYIGYSILTCGAYSTCWQYSLADRLKDNGKRYGILIQDSGLSILLYQTCGVLLCGLGPLIAMHKLCKNANKICAAYNRANGF